MSIPYPKSTGPDAPGEFIQVRGTPLVLRDSRRARLAAVTILPVLHVGCYWVTTRITLWRGPEALIRTDTMFDRLVPYVPESWPLYWLAYLFVIGGGGLAVFGLSEPGFRRAMIAVSGMIITGAVIQTLLPAQAPWPRYPATTQRLFHDTAMILPYATLPSMHVAFCAVTAGFLSHVFPGRLTRVLAQAIVLAVGLSTLMLREHVILDALSGLALARATVWWWQKGRV